MERSSIVPHISWRGPQPERETDAYLLAMLLRIYSSGLDFEDESKRDKMLHPSILTTENMQTIAMMYAYYKEAMDSADIKTTEDMLKMVKATNEEDVVEWIPQNEDAIRKSEAELLEFVETKETRGFSAFG